MFYKLETAPTYDWEDKMLWRLETTLKQNCQRLERLTASMWVTKPHGLLRRKLLHQCRLQ